MSRSPIKFFQLLVLISLSLISTLSFAERYEGHLKRMNKHLNLTDSQYAAVEEIIKSTMPQTKAIKEEMKELNKQLRQLVSDNNDNDSKDEEYD